MLSTDIMMYQLILTRTILHEAGREGHCGAMEVHDNDATEYMGMSYLLLSLLSNLLDGGVDGAWTGPLTMC